MMVEKRLFFFSLKFVTRTSSTSIDTLGSHWVCLEDKALTFSFCPLGSNRVRKNDIFEGNLVP